MPPSVGWCFLNSRFVSLGCCCSLNLLDCVCFNKSANTTIYECIQLGGTKCIIIINIIIIIIIMII